jgi:hypothetical protein
MNATLSFIERHKRLFGLAIILLAAGIAVAPLLRSGPSCGSDLFFHLASWIEARNSMLLFIPYPHWAPGTNFGAGEPRFVFYPPLTWMTGAALGLVLPWRVVGSVFGFLLLAATGLANRALAREVLEDGPATLAGCASIFSGFTLLTFYGRSDFAELAGGFWIPLMILFLLRNRNPSSGFWRRALDGSTVALALTVAGVWLSNGPAALMASYLLAALATAAAVVGKSWAPLIRASIASVIGLGLAGNFLLPAAWERHWVNLHSAIEGQHFQVEYSWLFSHHTDHSFLLLDHDKKLQVVSWVGVSMIAVTLLSALIAARRGTLPGPRRLWVPLLLVPFAVLFLLLPISLPVWNLLPLLRYLQFSWRWLLVLEAPMAIFFAAAIWFVPVRKRIPVLAACCGLFLVLSAGAGKYWSWFQECEAGQDHVVEAEEIGIGVHGKPEYAPMGVRSSEVRYGLWDACLVPALASDSPQPRPPLNPPPKPRPGGCSAGFKAVLFQPEHKQVTGVADYPGYLLVKLRSYPAWRVTVNGRPTNPAVEPEYGLMAVPVPQGPVKVIIDWGTTSDVIAGRWISVVSLLLFIGLWLLERRANQAHLS